jgi:hypothetical protein
MTPLSLRFHPHGIKFWVKNRKNMGLVASRRTTVSVENVTVVM